MTNPFATAWEGFQIALIVWVICVVCTVVPAAFEPVKHVQRIEPPKIVKLQDRHKERTWLTMRQ